jgi:hypothetical protein
VLTLRADFHLLRVPPPDAKNLPPYSVELFPPSVHANAASALASLHASGGINPDTLRLHKENPMTTHKNCPGTKIVKRNVIAFVSAALANQYPGEHVPGALA